MSVSQMKKAASALKSYLHNDQFGQELLEALLRELHDVRHELASHRERADRAETSLKDVRVRQERDAMTIAELKSKQASLEDRAHSAESRSILLKEQLNKRVSTDAVPQQTRHQKSSGLFNLAKRARKWKTFPQRTELCGVTSARHKEKISSKDPPVFDVDAILDGDISDESIWYLGASIFLASSLLGTVVLSFDIDWTDNKNRYGKMPPRMWRHYRKWFDENLAPEEPENTWHNGQHYDIVVRSY